MSSLFFWIIIFAFLIPMAMRYYRKSVRGRDQGQGMTGGQSSQPRDGFTQSDYYGGFGQLGAPQPPAKQQYPVPYEDSPGYSNNPPQAGAPQQPWQPQPPAPAPGAPVPPSAPLGFRARKLAELDERYSTGELSMEDYMAQRAEIMKG